MFYFNTYTESETNGSKDISSILEYILLSNFKVNFE